MPDTDIRIHPKEGGLIQPYYPGAEADLISEEFRVRYKINEWGYRDKTGRTLKKQDGKSRVLILGDSFSEGFGVEMAETYAALLEKEQKDWDLWNTARMGSSPLFYVYQLRELLPKLKPDLVIVQLFDNDLNENEFRRAVYKENGELGPLPESLRPSDAWTNALPRLTLVAAWKRLRRKMKGKALPRLFVKPGVTIPKESLVFNGPEGTSPAFQFYDPKKLKEWDEVFQRQEKLLRQLTREFRELAPGSKLVFLYVPHVMAFQFSKNGNLAELKRANPHGQLIEKIAGDMKVTLIDSTEFFLPDPTLYYYSKDLHWNAKGHKRVAEKLAPRLLEELKRP